MKDLELGKILIVALAITGVIAVTLFTINNKDGDSLNFVNDNKVNLNLTVYLQDKTDATLTDCGVTYAKEIQVPYTKAVTDGSLKYLFENELAQYGNYDSVMIKDSVAMVTIVNDNDPTGLWLSSLSSCESRHLLSVLQDTLTQYESIESIELYSPSGKIEF